MVHDAIRNNKAVSFSFVNTFSRDFIKNHVFSDMTPVLDNNILLYKIKFSAVTVHTLKFIGEIYIQPKDYSIHKLDYSGYYITEGEKTKNMFNIKIEYDHQYSIDSLMYLKYISFSNIFSSIDPSDSSCFKINKSYSDPSDATNSTIVFEFNNRIEKESATKASHYKISFGNNRAKIKNIIPRDSAVIVFVEKHTKDNSFASKQCTAEVKGIKDINGRILNETRYNEFYQFRELFVEDYNTTPSFVDSCYMINKPLFQNCISKSPDSKKYWMNTPINSKTQK